MPETDLLVKFDSDKAYDGLLDRSMDMALELVDDEKPESYRR